MKPFPIILLCGVLVTISCTSKQNKTMKFNAAPEPMKLITVDPGHFHAALVQKAMYPQLSPDVYVYAPEGPDVLEHLNRIDAYNARSDSPTFWKEIVYLGQDFLQKMIAEKRGDVMMVSGNNRRKIGYIQAAVSAGIHVLADKPMCIDQAGFEALQQAFTSAQQNGVLVYDIMTERYEITTILQKKLAASPKVFGRLLSGTMDDPAVTKESVHHLFKYVSGKPLKRPAWFFDTTQQGEGIVDVSTHLVDLIQWECFPEQIIDYQQDIQLFSAKRWPTQMTLEQFNKVTQLVEFPDFLQPNVSDHLLSVYCNGEFNYTIKGIHAKVSVVWNFEAPEGTGDTHYSIMRGSNSSLIIKQGREQNYRPELYIMPSKEDRTFERSLNAAVQLISKEFPGLALIKCAEGWQIGIPDQYRVNHEAHFAQVTEKYLGFLKAGELPAWEVPNMIAKYYTTTAALTMAKGDR
ncbi:MAG: oxidoreductase [Calditrichaeota bacterium]|nr:MAG: oxidoreductase [Calditrichota bacterium]